MVWDEDRILFFKNTCQKVKDPQKKLKLLFEGKRLSIKHMRENSVYMDYDEIDELSSHISWFEDEISCQQSIIYLDFVSQSKYDDPNSKKEKNPKISKKSSKKNDERIIWNLSEDSLNELFEDLINAGYIQHIEKYQIFNHFLFKLSEDNKINNYYEDFNKIVWLKGPTLFATFLNTLISKKAITIPNHKKFKIFCIHFLDDKFQEFDSQKLAKLANQSKSNKTDPYEELIDLIYSLR